MLPDVQFARFDAKMTIKQRKKDARPFARGPWGGVGLLGWGQVEFWEGVNLCEGWWLCGEEGGSAESSAGEYISDNLTSNQL